MRIREASVNEPPFDASKWRTMTSKSGSPWGPGKSMAATYLLAMRCPVYRRRDSNLGFGRELENLLGDGKGKGTSGSIVRPNVPRRPAGADCFVVAVRRGNARGATGAGHSRRDSHTGQLLEQDEPSWFRRKAAAFGEWHEPDKSRGLRPVL